MDVEHILRILNSHSVEYVVLGMAGLMPHSGVPVTSNLGILIADTPENRTELNFALQDLGCHSSPSENIWKAVEDDHAWLEEKSVHALTCPHGTLEIFRKLKGIEDGFEACKSRASILLMLDGEMYYSLSTEDATKVSRANTTL